MRRKAALVLLMILAAGMLWGTGIAEDAPEFLDAEDTAMRLPDEILMTYYTDTVFAGDSQVAKFRNFVKVKRKDDPDYFAGVDFRAANSYKFRYVTYKKLEESEGAHLTDGGSKVTLYTIAKKVQPKRLFLLAGLNDAFTTDYTQKRHGKDETGYDRAARYVREMTELIRSVSPDTQIYIISQMPVTKDFVQGSHKGKDAQERFDLVNETVRQECEALGIRYVDLATGLKGENGLLPSAYCGDGLVHLNDEGYEIFARELLDFAQAEYEAGNWVPAAAEAGEE